MPVINSTIVWTSCNKVGKALQGTMHRARLKGAGVYQVMHLADGSLEVQGVEVWGRLKLRELSPHLSLHLQQSRQHKSARGLP